MHVLELHERAFDLDLTDDERWKLGRKPRGWRLFAPCGGDDPSSCHLFQAADAMEERDFHDCLNLLLDMCKKAASDAPWRELYPDEKRFHDVGDVDIKVGKELRQIKIMQIRKNNVRLMWFYGGGNKIVIAGNTFVKRKKKTPDSEKEAIKKIAEQYFNDLLRQAVVTVSAQGGDHDFSAAFKGTRQ